MNMRLPWLLLGTALLAGAAVLVWMHCDYPSDDVNSKSEESRDPDVPGPALFEEVAASSGINFTYRNGEEVRPPHLSILESLGGGVALLDYDGDGFLDIFVTGGGYFAGPDKKEIRGHPCKLYKNLGNGKFKDVTHEAGLDSLARGQPWFYSHAAAVADYDRDGWPDLLVTGWGRIALFRNVPNGKGGRCFVDVSAKAGLDKGITWATSAAWADLDGDGWPDLYVCQYVDWSWDNNPKCNYDGKTPDVCPPKKFQGLPHKVYRNESDGQGGRRFVDVSNEAGLRMPRTPADYQRLTHLSARAKNELREADKAKEFGKGLGVLIVDVNLDGKPDIFVANDTVAKFLYINQSSVGHIRLKEQGTLAGVALDGDGNANGSMGLDAGDPDGSGLPALWVTNYENELHALYKNQSTRDHVIFLFNTPASGIGAIGQKYVGWGTGFVDIDHHGWEDLFIANGHAIRYPTSAARRQKPVLLRNQNGRFKDITNQGGPYFQQPHLARGVALGDLDNRGKIDLVVSHLNEPVAVLHNVAKEGNHWLGVDLVGEGNADIVGARVILNAGGRKQTRFAKGGGSYASCPDQRAVFGLGKTGRIDKATVIWPNGRQQEWTGLDVDSYHTLVQGEKKARKFRRKN
jgi:hypothetical protein